MKRPANQSPGYREFIRARDQALEILLNRARERISDALGSALSRIADAAAMSANRLQGSFGGAEQVQIEAIFVRKMEGAFSQIYPYLVSVLERLNRHAYLLSYAGETEALARATNATLKYENPKADSFVTFDEQSLLNRVEYGIWKIKQEILKQFKLSCLQELPPDEFLAKVQTAFPRKRKTPERRTVLRDPKLQEAAGGSKNYAFGTLDETSWDELVDDYLGREIPTYPFRKPEIAPDKYYVPSKDREYYVWEIEQEATQSFVDQVRAGQVDSAEAQGIKDFIWIAVVDDRTDECCLWRDGLTTDEIEHRLRTDHKGDECKVSTPPAHFNCATAGHKIITDSGEKLIEEIRIGDRVITHANRFRRVTRTLQSEVDELIRITLNNGTVLEVTPDHPFMIDGQSVMASQLVEGSKLSAVDSDQKSGTFDIESQDSKAHDVDTLSKESCD